MNDFARVLRLALRHRLAFAGCIGSSLIVALLWGANISSVFPMVEVVFAGHGASGYVDQRAAEAERSAAEATVRARQLRQQIASTTGGGELSNLRWELDQAETSAIAYDRSAEALRWVQPWATRYLPATPFGTLALVVGLLISATLLKLVALTANLMLVQDIAQRVGMQIREIFFRRALRQDLEHFGESGSSALTSRLTGDVNDLTLGVTIVLGRLILEPLKMIVCLAGAAMICWRLLLLTLVVAPIVGLIINSLSHSIRRSSRRVMEEMTQLYGMLTESFTGIRIVRAYNTEAYQRARFRQGAMKYYRKSMRVAFYNSASRFASEALGTTIICVGLLAGGMLVLNQQTHLFGIPMSATPLSKGEMILFFGLLIGASDPARKLSDVWSNLQRGIAASQRLMEIIDAPIRITEPKQPRAVPRPHREISFRNVTFRYPTGPEVLRGVDLEIPHGENLAVVGPNGSGKSTIVGLLCRFDDPTSGEVRIHDVCLRQMRSRDLRRRIGLVTQKTVIFDDTLLNNIRYGSPRATREQAIRAAEQAHADEFIRTKTPHGYDSLLGHNGLRLSGGQMQRLALARAFLRNPDILILDEATSQIDLESEHLIHQALAGFLRGRTGIMITHRPTTLMLADRVAVLEEGRVADWGTPSELAERNLFYQSLCGASARKAA